VTVPNPFTLGIVKGGDFCDRQKELAEFVRYGENSQNAVLYSPRRYGKSSLVLQVLRVLGEKGFVPVYVDLFPVSSEHDFISRFASAIFKGVGRGADPTTMADKLKGLFQRLIPTVEITPQGVTLFVKSDREARFDVLLDDLMEGLYGYTKKKGLKVCVVFDEFQEITELDESKKIEGILRSYIQQHKEVVYLFVGSRRHILKDIFTDRKRPFYKSAFLYELGEISEEDFTAYIETKFRGSGKMCPPEVAKKIYHTVRGYPYYVQKLALFAWDITEEVCSSDIIDSAYETLLTMESRDFEGIWSSLTIVQKSVLKAIAAEPTRSPFAKDYLGKYNLSIGGAQKAINSLVARDLIERDQKGNFRLTDPVMSAWLVKV
jgi:AAA+ ATPase superfamily predicted ATPase